MQLKTNDFPWIVFPWTFETYFQIIGGFTSLLGVFVLALPVPLILNTFSLNYRNRVWKQEVKIRKSERASQEGETASEPIDPGDH